MRSELEIRNGAKYKTSHDLDYHHEKIALIRLAQHLMRQGWPEVRLSAREGSLASDCLDGIDPGDLEGVDLHSDAIFSEKFRQNFDRDETFRYKFYGDRPGGIDLVARRRDEVLLVEAKGRSRRDRRGGVYELIGRLVASRTDDDGRSYGILIPDTWRAVLPAQRPSLRWLTVFLIEREGHIEETTLSDGSP